jgi:hypothetical protein
MQQDEPGEDGWKGLRAEIAGASDLHDEVWKG